MCARALGRRYQMADDTILETRGLTKEFKGFVAVKDVSLTIRRGSIHALIGPNGAGKTTCFNLLTHFLTPTRGQIFFKGNGNHGIAAGGHRAHRLGALVPDFRGVSEPDRPRKRPHCIAAQTGTFAGFLALRGLADTARRAERRS